MTTVEPGVGSSGLVSRVKNIIMSPRTEWDRIDAEPATIKGLYLNYICILAAIPAVCRVIGDMIPVGGFGFYVHMSPVAAVADGVCNYIGALIGAYVVALIIDVLAPSFDGQRNQVQALKVVAYSMTPVWLAGIFFILPMLRPLAIVGLYGAYLMYLGLPKLMNAPEEKALGYTIVSIIVSIVVVVAIAAVLGMLALGSML